MCGLKALTLHDNPSWDKSQPSHWLESYAISRDLTVGLSNRCQHWQWDFSPRKAHNHKGPISVVKKDLTSSHWPNSEAQWKLLEHRLILRYPDRSLHTRWAHRIDGSRTSKVWNTAMYSARKAGICREVYTWGMPLRASLLFSGIQHF